MQTDEHTSEMVWMWTIKELCREVAPIQVPTYVLCQKELIEAFPGILIPL